MSMQELEAQRDAMNATLAAMRRAAEDNGGRLDNVEAASAEFQRQHAALSAKIDAFMRQQTERAAVGANEDRALAPFFATEDDRKSGVVGQKAISRSADGANNSLAYVEREGVGAVQMFATDRPVVDGNEVARVTTFGLVDDPNPRSEWQCELQELYTTYSIVRSLTKSGRAPQTRLAILRHLRRGPDSIRKIFADSSGLGADWMTERAFPLLERDLDAPVGFSSVFPVRDFPAGGAIRLPYASGHMRVYKDVVPTTNNPPDATLSTFNTESSLFETTALVTAYQAHRDATEDSIIAVAPEVVAHMLEAYRFGTDDIWISGDTASTHQDAIASWNIRGMLGTSNLGDANDHRRSWLGLRAYCADVSQTSDGGSAQTADGLRTGLNNLDARILMPNLLATPRGGRLVAVTSPEYFFGTMLGFAEFETVDSIGVFASLLTGTLGNVGAAPAGLPGLVGFLWGQVPVLISYAFPPDLNASGIYDGATTTKTGLILFDRTRRATWRRKGLQIESEDDIRNNTRTWVARARKTGRHTSPIADAVADAHYIYNYTS